MRVLVFGDSITQGFWDSKGGWVNRLRKHYDERQLRDLEHDTEPTIFNLGVSGDRIASLLWRFENETMARLGREEQIACVFAIGINDTYLEGKDPVASPDIYQESLNELLNKAKKFTDRILFVGMSPCDEAKTTPVAWRDITYTNERILEFEQVLKKFCEDNDLPYVQIFEKFQAKQKEQELFADGLHPNDAGHQLIAELVKPALESLIV